MSSPLTLAPFLAGLACRYLPDDMVGADAATQHTSISAGGITSEVVKATRDPDSAQHERDAHSPKRNGCAGCKQA